MAEFSVVLKALPPKPHQSNQSNPSIKAAQSTSFTLTKQIYTKHIVNSEMNLDYYYLQHLLK